MGWFVFAILTAVLIELFTHQDPQPPDREKEDDAT
jgi:hypothetical protein